MKIASIGDIHLSKYSNDKIDSITNLPERLSSIRNVLYEVADYCTKNDIPNIAIVGDISHNKSIIYSVAQDLMIQFFKDNQHITFYVIDGNHDLSSKGDEAVSALRPLESISNVVWISHKTTMRMKDDILFVPYSYKIVDNIKNNKARILFSHFGLSEGMLNSGISIVSDISLKDLQGKYELVILGHYHKPQEIILPNFQLYYTGSLIQLDWGEKNDLKRFLVIDTTTLKVDSIPINNYKKHIEVEITANNKDEIIKLAQQAKQSGDHFKVIMKEKVDISNISEDINIVDKTEKDITNRGITTSMTEEDKLKMYVKIKEIQETDLEEYVSIGKELIDSCEDSL